MRKILSAGAYQLSPGFALSAEVAHERKRERCCDEFLLGALVLAKGFAMMGIGGRCPADAHEGIVGGEAPRGVERAVFF